MFAYLSSLVLLLVFIPANTYETTCLTYQITCGTYPYTWCCSMNQQCGSFQGDCDYIFTTTPLPPRPSDSLPIFVTVIFVGILFVLCVVCMVCCLRSTQSHQQAYSSPAIVSNQEVIYPYQQQHLQGPLRVVQVRPFHNYGAALATPTLYEAPPPTYEDATTHLVPKYPSTLLSAQPVNVEI